MKVWVYNFATMKAQKTIFNLIQSLSKGEKRTFSLSATKYTTKKNNSVLQLYQIFESAQNNENVHLDKEIPKMGKTPLSVLKNKLVNQILQTLRISSSYSRHPLFFINEKQEFASILYHRGLFEEAATYSRQSMNLAAKFEYFERMLASIDQLEQIYFRNPSNKSSKVHIDELYEKRKVILTKLENLWEYKRLVQKMYAIYLNYQVPQNEMEQDEYEQCFNNPLLQSIDNCLSLKAKMRFYTLKVFQYNMENKVEQAYLCAQEQLKFIEEEYPCHQYEPDKYLFVLNNLILISINLQKFDESLKWLEILEDCDKKFRNYNTYYKRQIFETKYSSLLDYAIETGNYEIGLSYTKQIEKGIKKFESMGLSKDRIIRFHFGLALLNYYQKKYTTAQNLILNVLNEEQQVSAALTVGVIARILDLILNYELGYLKYLDKRANNAKSFLIRHKRFGKAEEVFFKYFIKLVKANNTEKKYAIISEMEEALMNFDTVGIQSDFCTYLKIDEWIAKVKEENKFQ